MYTLHYYAASHTDSLRERGNVIEAFKHAVFPDMVACYGVEFIDFNSKPSINKQISHASVVTETKICQHVYCFIVLMF